MSDVADVKQALLTKTKKPTIDKKDLCSTGSTLLNLAFSGRSSGGIPKGKYVLLIGDSDTGKSWLGMSLLAEAANNPEFDEYKLIYNNAEDGALMDTEQFFGSKAAERIKIKQSELLDDFYDNILTRLDRGDKFIEILDSHDVLEAKEDDDKDRANRERRKKGVKEKGTFGMAKAKLNSTKLRKVRSKLRKTGSILVIISQTRDNPSAVGRGDTKTRAGGRALKFYCIAEMWTSLRQNITKKIKKVERQLGVKIKCKFTKNHIIGAKHTVYIPIYHSFGIDDVGSCVDWLIEQKHWKAGQFGVKAPEFDFVGNKSKLIRHIEEEDGEHELRMIVSRVWKEIEESCRVKRKKRYA